MSPSSEVPGKGRRNRKHARLEHALARLREFELEGMFVRASDVAQPASLELPIGRRNRPPISRKDRTATLRENRTPSKGEVGS